MPDCLLNKEGLGSYVSVTKGLLNFKITEVEPDVLTLSLRIILAQLNVIPFDLLIRPIKM